MELRVKSWELRYIVDTLLFAGFKVSKNKDYINLSS